VQSGALVGVAEPEDMACLVRENGLQTLTALWSKTGVVVTTANLSDVDATEQKATGNDQAEAQNPQACHSLTFGCTLRVLVALQARHPLYCEIEVTLSDAAHRFCFALRRCLPLLLRCAPQAADYNKRAHGD